MEFVQDKNAVKPTLLINNGQFSAKLKGSELENAVEALKKLSPAARERLESLDEGATYTHRSFLNALLFQVITNLTDGIEVEELKTKYEKLIQEKDAAIDVHVNTILELNQRMQEEKNIDAEKYVTLDKEHPKLKDFFLSYEKRKAANEDSNLESFVFKMYKFMLEHTTSSDRIKSKLSYSPELYKK